MIRKLFEGDFKYLYWTFMNRAFGEPKGGCLCTMREECQVCWTHWQKELQKPSTTTEFKPEPKIDVQAIERNQIFK